MMPTDIFTSRQFWMLALASAIGGLIVIWLAPAVRRLPPT